MNDLPPTPTERYDQGCPIAIGLDQVGERWSLAILRDLSSHDLRFSDLIALNPGLSPNLLTKRLKKHVNLGVVERRYLRPPASGYVYSITETYRQPVTELVQALAAFGIFAFSQKEPTKDTDDQILQYLQNSIRLINFREVDLTGTFSIKIADTTTHLSITNGTLAVEETAPSNVTASIVAAVPRTLNFILEITTNPEAAIEDGSLQVTGEVEAGIRFVKLFGKRPQPT